MVPQMRNLLLPVLLSALALGSRAATAQEDYDCTIERVESADLTQLAILKLERATYVGKRFTVERSTGLMAGALKNSYVTKPIVVDYGAPKQNSYKVVTTMRITEGAGYGSHLYVLVVDEFVEDPVKPFAFLDNDTTYFGICRHF